MNHVNLPIPFKPVYLRMEEETLCFRVAHIILPISLAANRYLTGLSMSTHPFIRNIAHGFDGAITYPGHEVTVQLELGAALVKEETPGVLRVFVVGVDAGLPGDDAAMPIEIHVSARKVYARCKCPKKRLEHRVQTRK